MSFRLERSFHERRAEAQRILAKHERRVPVIVETHGDSLQIVKDKFLVPEILTFGQLAFVIKRRIKIQGTNRDLNFLINNTFPMHTAYMKEIYDTYKHEDGFLYCTVVPTNTFGTFTKNVTDLIKYITAYFNLSNNNTYPTT